MSPVPAPARAGVTAVELLVALVLVAGVVHGAWRVFAAQRTASEAMRLRTEVLDTDRAARVILGAELAAGLPGRDWSVPAPGVVELRAFRGWAAVCPGDPAGGSSGGPGQVLVVAYRGLRLPDPEKDSVLVLDAAGRWTAAALTARAAYAEGCAAAGGGASAGAGAPAAAAGMPAPGAALERWTLDPPVPGAVILRVFERGSYHLVDGSLRYRRGAGGRQPLTPAVLDPDLSGVRAGAGGATAVLSLFGADGRGGGWTRRLFGNGGWGP